MLHLSRIRADAQVKRKNSMATKRQKRLRKARNIARNNMQKVSGLQPNITAKNAHLIPKAFNAFQASRKRV